VTARQQLIQWSITLPATDDGGCVLRLLRHQHIARQFHPWQQHTVAALTQLSPGPAVDAVDTPHMTATAEVGILCMTHLPVAAGSWLKQSGPLSKE